MLAGPATLDQLAFVLPSIDLARIQAATTKAALRTLTDPQYFETLEDKETCFIRKSLPSSVDGTKKTASPCTMSPHYTICEWEKAGPIMREIFEAANQEPGCIYFGWERSGNKLHSRETFVDGDSLKTHVDRVKLLIDELRAGPATLDRLEVTGPASELAKIKVITAGLSPHPEYFEIEGEMKHSEAPLPQVGVESKPK